MCAGDVAVPVGQTVYTGLLNTHGGYTADVTITRVARDEFLLVTGAASVAQDQDHLQRHIDPDLQVSVSDVSGAFAVFGVMGPSSRSLLESVSRSSWDNAAFPFASSAMIDVGRYVVRATRITYVGELGWELYVPVEIADGVYELLIEAGRPFALRPAGYYAMNAMRLEKGYRAFGSDLTPELTPIEAGLSFTTKINTDHNFLGRDALVALKKAGLLRRLTGFSVNQPDVILWGGELLLRKGIAVGQVTSAAWGTTLGRAVGLALRWSVDGDPVDLADLNGPGYEVNVGGETYEVNLSTKSLYDPNSARIRR